MLKLFRISILLIVFCTLAVFAQVPGQISWQGVLTDSNGDGLNGSYEITIRIFSSDDTVNDLTPLWEETYTKTLNDGLFNVIIGEDSGNPLNISFDSQYWMEVEVDSDDAPLPRVKLTSSPYSLMSKTVEDGAITTPKLANDAVSTPKILDEAVTTEKIEDEAVTTEKIDDEAVISSKIADNTVVRSIGNPASLTDDVNLVEGLNVKIKNNFPNIDDIEISALGELKIEVNIDNSINIFVWNPVINNWNIWIIIFPNGNIWWFGPIIINNYIFVYNENNDSGVLIDPEDGIIIYDEDGNIVGWWRTDGTSEHWGLETFHKGVLVPLAGGGWIIIDDLGFTIYDANGNIVTDFAPDGTSFHKGKETFAGGIEIENDDGSSILIDEDGITIYDSNGDVVGRWRTDGTSEHFGDEVFHEKIIKQNPDGSSTVTDENGTTHTDADGNTTQTGPGGSSTTHTDPDTGETNTTSTGASGTTTTRTDDEGNESTTEVSPDGVKYTDADGNVIEIGPEGITIHDADGNLMTYFGKDGTSYHAGDEIYAGKIIKINEDGSMIEISAEGIKVYDENGDVVGGINADGSIIGSGDISLEGGFEVPLTGGGKLVVDENGVRIVDADGNEMTVFNPDGTSYHAGREIFAGGIEIPLEDGGRIIILPTGVIIFEDADGNITGGMGQDADGSFIATGAFEVETENGSVIIDENGVTVYDSQGNIVTSFAYDGTSYHAGLETFAGGIEIPLSGGGKAVIDEDGITIYDAEDNVLTRFGKDGTSYHAGKEVFAGGIEVTAPATDTKPGSSTDIDGGTIRMTYDGATGYPLLLSANSVPIAPDELNPGRHVIHTGGVSLFVSEQDEQGDVTTTEISGGLVQHKRSVPIAPDELNPGRHSYHTGGASLFVSEHKNENGDVNSLLVSSDELKFDDIEGNSVLLTPSFMEFEGISGESSKTKFDKEWIDVNSWQTGLGRTQYGGGRQQITTPLGDDGPSSFYGVVPNDEDGFDLKLDLNDPWLRTLINPGKIEFKDSDNTFFKVDKNKASLSVPIELVGLDLVSIDPIEISNAVHNSSKSKWEDDNIYTEATAAGIFIKIEGIDGETTEKTEVKAGFIGMKNSDTDSWDPMLKIEGPGDENSTLFQVSRLETSGKNLNFENGFFGQLNSTSLGVEGNISGNNGNFGGNLSADGKAEAKTLVVNPDQLDLGEGVLAFEVYGNGNVHGDLCVDDLCENSDIRLKRDFAPITNASNLISQIKGYYHYWINPNNQERQIGVIAQELEKIFPELVHTKDDGFKAVNYSKLTAVLIEAFKEQQTEIEDLQKQINSFKQQADNYNTLKSENEQLSKEISEMRTMMKYIIDQMQNEPSGILKTENINE